MTKPFTVIVLRPDWFLHEVGDFDNMHDMQYVAEVHAESGREAAELGRDEVFKIDKGALISLYGGDLVVADHDLSELDPADYTVLGVFPGHGAYEPIWDRLR
jgi:hypothetical protein